MAHDSEDSAWARHVRAGVYQRVSKLASARDRKEIERARSIEEQNKANQDECDRNGWTITERYEDPGLSASRFATKARPEYRRLLADIRAGKLDVVVLWESSRGDRPHTGTHPRFTGGHDGPMVRASHQVGMVNAESGREWVSSHLVR